MSLESILRYEQGTKKSAHLRQAYQMQVDRIKNDEMMAERENLVRLHKYGDFWDDMASHLTQIEEAAMDEETRRKENNVSQRAQWNESLEESSWKKRIREENKKIKEELRMAVKASLAVRRVALQQLLAKECAQYEAELQIQGKTFFKQRI